MFKPRVLLVIFAVLYCSTVLHAVPVTKTPWLLNYDQAMALARKSGKPVMAYFSGSDWDPWTQKLEKDVLETDLFRAWAAENVVLLRVDFPHLKKPAGTLKSQADKLKLRYSISKVPSVAFLDSAGSPFQRTGYDDLRLRDDERDGAPLEAMKYLAGVIANRPPDETLVQQKTLDDGIAFARKHFISLLILVTQGNASGIMKIRADLLTSQPFIRFVNHNMGYVELHWPEDSDTSEQGKQFRAMLQKNNVTPAPIQLLVWDMQTSKIKGRMSAIVPDHIEPLIVHIQDELPRIDYKVGWIEDYRLAQAIAAQQRRYIFINFTSSDNSDWSQKLDDEILKTDDFKTYAQKNLVLLKIDFPKDKPQPDPLVIQNRTLQEMYNVRGYPTVIVVNPLGQKLAMAKYQKGGPGPFLAEIDAYIKKDTERRALLANEDAMEQ